MAVDGPAGSITSFPRSPSSAATTSPGRGLRQHRGQGRARPLDGAPGPALSRYGLARHKGYGTAAHLKLSAAWGRHPSIAGFAPVRPWRAAVFRPRNRPTPPRSLDFRGIRLTSRSSRLPVALPEEPPAPPLGLMAYLPSIPEGLRGFQRRSVGVLGDSLEPSPGAPGTPPPSSVEWNLFGGSLVL